MNNATADPNHSAQVVSVTQQGDFDHLGLKADKLWGVSKVLTRGTSENDSCNKFCKCGMKLEGNEYNEVQEG